MASLLVDELRAKGKPSVGWCFSFPLFDIVIKTAVHMLVHVPTFYIVRINNMLSIVVMVMHLICCFTSDRIVEMFA